MVGSGGAVQITAFPLLVAASTQESFDVQARESRRRIANGASTPAYRAILEHHGWGEAQTELLELTRQGRLADMPDVIDDEMLGTIAAVGTPDEAARTLLARHGDTADRLIITTTFTRGADGRQAVPPDRAPLLERLRVAQHPPPRRVRRSERSRRRRTNPNCPRGRRRRELSVPQTTRLTNLGGRAMTRRGLPPSRWRCTRSEARASSTASDSPMSAATSRRSRTLPFT